MISREPLNQTKLYGLNYFFNELILLDQNNSLPNKILLSGQKGLGKSTMAYHFINYILSKNEDFKYNTVDLEINTNNRSYKTSLNKSNPNIILIDLKPDKQSIDINQIRELISSLNKSSFNNKPRFVLIDNIEFLNNNSVNALLKVVEEPNSNIHFILINNDKKILPTLKSRCINFKISLSNQENILIANQLLDGKLSELINKDLINYYSTPGNIFNLAKFAKFNDYDLSNLNLKEFLNILIKNNHYKKDSIIKYLVYDFVEFYFNKINYVISPNIYKSYNYFMKRISDTKKFNLDEESLFMEFEQKILNG
ncbi:AAA family ATPase [Candidatus Pelagibacter sp.]|nr:AAA family ATPase [Candidatus Pelagibacter sp.]